MAVLPGAPARHARRRAGGSRGRVQAALTGRALIVNAMLLITTLVSLAVAAALACWPGSWRAPSAGARRPASPRWSRSLESEPTPWPTPGCAPWKVRARPTRWTVAAAWARSAPTGRHADSPLGGRTTAMFAAGPSSARVASDRARRRSPWAWSRRSWSRCWPGLDGRARPGAGCLEPPTRATQPLELLSLTSARRGQELVVAGVVRNPRGPRPWSSVWPPRFCSSTSAAGSSPAAVHRSISRCSRPANSRRSSSRWWRRRAPAAIASSFRRCRGRRRPHVDRRGHGDPERAAADGGAHVRRRACDGATRSAAARAIAAPPRGGGATLAAQQPETERRVQVPQPRRADQRDRDGHRSRRALRPGPAPGGLHACSRTARPSRSRTSATSACRSASASSSTRAAAWRARSGRAARARHRSLPPRAARPRRRGVPDGVLGSASTLVERLDDRPRSRISAALARVRPRGGTAMYDAVAEAIPMAQTRHAPQEGAARHLRRQRSQQRDRHRVAATSRFARPRCWSTRSASTAQPSRRLGRAAAASRRRRVPVSAARCRGRRPPVAWPRAAAAATNRVAAAASAPTTASTRPRCAS